METNLGIDPKWVKEENRLFSIYPGLPTPDNGTSGEEELWMELAQFVKDDLQWLLSLNHQKFWSYMVFSENSRNLLVSFLKKCPPNYLKNDFLTRDDVRNLFRDIERLVFLVFIRLSSEQEGDHNFVRNLGEIIYNNYLFTVPIILDICSIYGVSNRELVKEIINNVVTMAPDFWDDLKEVVPQFLQALKVVSEKFSQEHLPKLKDKIELRSCDIRDLVFYLHDSVSTIQIFLDLFAKGRELFSKLKIISEIVSFYANIIPEIENKCRGDKEPATKVSLIDLTENTRVDLLRMVKNVFDYLADEQMRPNKTKEESVDECLNLMMELLSEPLFLLDYNKMYSIEFEIESLIQGCVNVDTVKVSHILKGVELAEQVETKERAPVAKFQDFDDVTGVKLNSLMTKVKDILPHLDEQFIIECLRHYQNDTEKAIAAILENTLPAHLQNWTSENFKEPKKSQSNVEYKGKHAKHLDFNEILDDREELKVIKDRYAEFEFLQDETYDDEYDDTYDENLDVVEREGDELEKSRRPFVTPRVLRTEEDEEKDEEEEDEDEDDDEEEEKRRDWFVQNPAEIRERNEQRRADRAKKDVVGVAKGQGQSKQVLRNREFKGTHKSFMANHNRKKQAGKKMNRGLIPS